MKPLSFIFVVTSTFVPNFFSLEPSPLAIHGQWLTRVRSAKAVRAFAVAPNVEGKEVQNKGEALRNLLLDKREYSGAPLLLSLRDSTQVFGDLVLHGILVHT